MLAVNVREEIVFRSEVRTIVVVVVIVLCALVGAVLVVLVCHVESQTECLLYIQTRRVLFSFSVCEFPTLFPIPDALCNLRSTRGCLIPKGLLASGPGTDALRQLFFSDFSPIVNPRTSPDADSSSPVSHSIDVRAIAIRVLRIKYLL